MKFFFVSLIFIFSANALGQRVGGNGGHWIELQFFIKMQEIIDQLPQNNPDKLDIKEIQNLLNNMNIELSEKPLFLEERPKEMINYLPNENHIVLHISSMEKRFNDDLDGDNDLYNFLYHEIIPQFKGKDSSYKFSRSLLFRKKATTLDSIQGGDFSFTLQDKDDPCLMRLIPEQPFLWVFYISNPTTPNRKCDKISTPIRMACNGNLCFEKSGKRDNVDFDFSIRFLSQNFLQWELVSYHSSWKSETKHLIRQNKFVKSDPKVKVFFTETAIELNKNIARIKTTCQTAKSRAIQWALEKCKSNGQQKYKECRVIDSYILSGLPESFENGCSAHATVMGIP